MHRKRKFIEIALQHTTLRKGLTISILVGTALNIINQGNFVVSDQLHQISALKVCLTYLTPFLVSVYSTTTALQKSTIQMAQDH
jgi:hypothetical protein